MRTNELFKQKTVLSFELFPPKKDAPVDTIYHTLSAMNDLKPDFISVTCGAGGSGGTATVQMASTIKNKYHRECVAHLPCINLTKDRVLHTLQELEDNHIENILALRGDRIPGTMPQTDFTHASELIAFIHEHSNCNIIGACYPEGHIESKSLADDIRHLKEKVDAGTSQLISQLFFDNTYFYNFLERTDIIGIQVPIQAGIMPVTNKKQIERMVTLCGATLPRKFQKIMVKYDENPEALRDAGIAYAIDQIIDLVAQGVDGIHIYTMNNPYIAQCISHAIKNIL